MATQKERLYEFIASSGYSIREFERKLELSNGAISHMNDSLPEKLRNKISTNFQHLNMAWLMYGTGNMLNNEGNICAISPESYDNTRTLPLVPIDVVAGNFSDEESYVTDADYPQYFVPEFIDAKAEFLIRVNGASMYPKYSSGDILACRKIKELTFIRWGKVYVIDSQQGAMVQRLFEIEDDKESVLCKSDNEDYPPFRLPKTEIRSLFIVVGVIRLE